MKKKTKQKRSHLDLIWLENDCACSCGSQSFYYVEDKNQLECSQCGNITTGEPIEEEEKK